MSNKCPKKASSITSTMLHKQDQLWENIITKFQRSIECRKTTETKMREHLFELKILIQGIYTYNLFKLLDKPDTHHAINALAQLKSTCPKDIQEGVYINLANVNFIFDIRNTDLKYMSSIKELKHREKNLLDKVNKFRIKDSVLIYMKKNIDKLMKQNSSNGKDYTIIEESLSYMPKEIINLLRKNRRLSDDLDDAKKENRKLENIMQISMVKKLLNLKNKNDGLALTHQNMKRALNNVPTADNNNLIVSNLRQSRCAVCDLTKVVESFQREVEILRYSINNMRQFM